MVAHPFYPVSLALPGYAAPVIPFQQVLAYFFAACGVLFALTWTLTGMCAPFCNGDLDLTAIHESCLSPLGTA